MFNCKEQRIKDVTEALEVIRPIITLLKELQKGENERVSKITAINTIRTDINVLDEANSEIKTEDIQRELAVIQKKYNERVSSMEETLNILTNKLINIREKITQYDKYCASFYYVSDEEIASELLEKAVQQDCSDDDFHLILLLLTNESIDNRNGVNELVISYSKKVEDSLREYILKNFEQFEFNDIVQLIKES